MSEHNSYGVFVHGLHKSASMFLYKIFRDLAQEANIDYYSANYKPEGSDKPLPNQKDLRRVTKASFCYCPVRHFAQFPEAIPPQKNEWADRPFIVLDDFPNLSKIYRIYQIRDPRDILVSEYFSFGFIHFGRNQTNVKKEKIQNMTIDEYCLEYADELLDKYQNIFRVTQANNPNYRIVQYETMVLDYRQWLLEVIQPFEFASPLETISEKYYQKYRHEFDPDQFQEGMNHKRKMIPGDHREKLQAATIEMLNTKFANVLKKFYSLEMISSTDTLR